MVFCQSTPLCLSSGCLGPDIILPGCNKACAMETCFCLGAARDLASFSVFLLYKMLCISSSLCIDRNKLLNQKLSAWKHLALLEHLLASRMHQDGKRGPRFNMEEQESSLWPFTYPWAY